MIGDEIPELAEGGTPKWRPVPMAWQTDEAQADHGRPEEQPWTAGGRATVEWRASRSVTIRGEGVGRHQTVPVVGVTKFGMLIRGEGLTYAPEKPAPETRVLRPGIAVERMRH